MKEKRKQEGIPMASKQVASQVLDYWFAIEFLGQDSYDACTEESKLVRELHQFKNSSPSTKSGRRQISVFETIGEGADIYSNIVNQAHECGMKLWGNLTFYIGRIRRQTCIEELTEKLGLEKKDQVEENKEYIPILSFQCTPDGVYVEHSLSFSTVVWAISQVAGGERDGKLSDMLEKSKYDDTIKELEEALFHNDDVGNQSNSATISAADNAEEVPKFAYNAIDASKIIDIHNEMKKEYGKYFSKDANAIEQKNGIRYQLFKDEKAKEKYDDDNYMGLSHDFFSDDLQMVKSSIERGRDDYSTGMLSDLIDYICAPYDEGKERKRHDFVKPPEKETFHEELAEILNMGNAPLGKWPSRFMPALMQQVAINIATSNRQRGIFRENGNIFSVNGPPGTGKTTLLKEIIANDIVEKARFLSQYDTPDDAFEGIRFEHGKLNGAYSKFYPMWYRFKDDHIADFGVLVTSSNNTAVENITKELPLENGILDNLKADNEKDSQKMIQQLGSIRALFSTSETEKRISIYKKGDADRQGEYPEIYFTGYAKKFFGTREKDADTWGMVAAPLGRKSNIRGFYYDVLNPILQDFLTKNADIDERLPEYRKAREAFKEQLEKVKSLREELKGYGDISLESHRVRFASEQIQLKNSALVGDAKEELGMIEQQLEDLRSQISEEEEVFQKHAVLFREADDKVKESEGKIKGLSDQMLSYQKEALEAEKSAGLFTKLFKKSQYQSALELAESLRGKAQEYRDDIACASQILDAEREEADKRKSAQDDASRKLQESKGLENKLLARQSAILGEIDHLEKEMEDAKNRADASMAECEDLLRDYRKDGNQLGSDDTRMGTVLDKAFVEDILSKDSEAGTMAQIANPWSTEEFNRERERLFYLALQMTKEFVLSSKACRQNLHILGQYWGLEKEEIDKKRINFDDQESEAMIGSLFQTLFLLTPVVSSTFASVGRLLKEMRTPGCFGTLIIDEAGQAQPQMAVGALYRAKKAIIVGDPKQVEPVVTDDLKLLKEAYSEPVLANYKDKSLSVQSCADIINPFGTSFDNGTDHPDWVGCPLLVHRRCISPMFDISNQISYDGIMKQQTLPPSESKVSSFVYERSLWIDVKGKEKGNGNHYVAEQGNKICEMVNAAFQKAADAKPNLYIIAPFTTVVNGLRTAIKSYAESDGDSALKMALESGFLGAWLYDSIGTVHKFQGKEANEVIFALGCDESQKERYAVTGFVNSNIVNVAATRAKYRFYIVGDFDVWQKNQFVSNAKSIIEKHNKEGLEKGMS